MYIYVCVYIYTYIYIYIYIYICTDIYQPPRRRFPPLSKCIFYEYTCFHRVRVYPSLSPAVPSTARPVVCLNQAHISSHSEVARTVTAPPSSVVECLWGVFVCRFGVLFVSCVCVGVGGAVLCRFVCV